MFSTKNILAAASLAVLTAAGIGGASAQPYGGRWDNDRYERRHDDRWDRRDEWRQGAFTHVNSWRIARELRFRGLHMISEPHVFRGRMMVRAEDRFGRQVIVHIDPRDGDIVRVIRL
jgi:hypothetical protein